MCSSRFVFSCKKDGQSLKIVKLYEETKSLTYNHEERIQLWFSVGALKTTTWSNVPPFLAKQIYIRRAKQQTCLQCSACVQYLEYFL
jgi:hypothetical protein